MTGIRHAYENNIALFASLGLALMLPLTVSAASAQVAVTGDSCDAYARNYADAHVGDGDMTGDVVDGGIRGAVAGGAWRGPSGARRGARVGGALGVLDNLGSMPGGWQALYDMAYQICANQSSTANIPPAALGAPGTNCRSSATVQPVPPRVGAPYSARSGCP